MNSDHAVHTVKEQTVLTLTPPCEAHVKQCDVASQLMQISPQIYLYQQTLFLHFNKI